MTILHHATELKPQGRAACLAIGMFDGVHLGHQQVIRQAVTAAEQHEALSVVVTFDQHPATILAPSQAPRLIYSLPHKLRTIGALGVDAILQLHFDREFSALSGEVFIRELARDFGRLHSVCVGSAFAFGHQRSGNVELLRRLGRELGFGVQGLAAVSLGGRTVSSTRIRETIAAGNLDAAQQMLGREYSLAACVIQGDQIGRKIGFPTANLDAAALALPPGGVYAIHAVVDRARHRGVLNIGHRPTLANPAPQLRVEAHLLDFTGDLYGREIEVTFVAKLRDECKFPSLDALRLQIAADVKMARQQFATQSSSLRHPA